jgi:hypothetical protein
MEVEHLRVGQSNILQTVSRSADRTHSPHHGAMGLRSIHRPSSVAEVAVSSPGPVLVLTSDVPDMKLLTGGRSDVEAV